MPPLTPEFLLALFNFAGPLVRDVIANWQKAHHTMDLPTHEQLLAEFNTSIDAILKEGADWKTAHPNA